MPKHQYGFTCVPASVPDCPRLSGERAETPHRPQATVWRWSPRFGEFSDDRSTPATHGHHAAAALAAFGDSEVDVAVSTRRQYPVLEQHADRFEHAELLFALKHDMQATRWYQSVVDGMALWGAPYRARVARRLQALAERHARNPQDGVQD